MHPGQDDNLLVLQGTRYIVQKFQIKQVLL